MTPVYVLQHLYTAHIPACHWKWSTASTAVGAGRTGRQRRTWVTHRATNVHQDAALSMTVNHDREIPGL